jgi:hypothetical protein
MNSIKRIKDYCTGLFLQEIIKLLNSKEMILKGWRNTRVRQYIALLLYLLISNRTVII